MNAQGDPISTFKTACSRCATYAARFAFISQYYSKKALFRLRRRLPHFKKAHINTFPAVHLKRLDGVDFTVKFSGELAVLGICGAVVAMNAYFFTLSSYEGNSDKSFFAKVLSRHPKENQKLYAQQTTIKTVVSGNHSFITLASADSFQGLEPQTIEEAYAAEEDYINTNVLAQPSPDSIDGLIAKQIKVYETKSGDTLKSIGQQFGISTQTIAWANKLPDTTIKPGWFLVILPTDGILHKATSNDTLPDLAKRYGVGIESIISYNGLESAEDIDKDQLIIIPGGKMPEPPKPKPAAPKPNDGKVNPQGVVKPKVVNNGAGHIFPWGYCTWYVASQVYVPWGGNAKNWLTNAKAYGAVIASEPAVGAIVVTNDNARYGHVALIKKVEEGRFLVSEMNYEKFGKVNDRWISRNSKSIRGFIYP